MAKGSTADQHIRPNRGVPQIDGTLSKWKEYETRALIFIARLHLEKKEGEAALTLSAGLTGDAEGLVKPNASRALID